MELTTLSFSSFDSRQEGQGYKKFEIEKRLDSVLKEIDNEKKKFRQRVIYLTGREFLQEAKAKPWCTALKGALLLMAIGSLYPIGIGSFACLNSYRIDDLSNIDSSDLEKASVAVQTFSNLGQGIAFVSQVFEILLIPSTIWLFRGIYNRTVCREIESIFSKKILTTPCLSEEEITFLLARANKELFRYGGFPINGEGDDIELIQNEIDREKSSLLSKRNIIYLVGQEIIKDVKSSSYTAIFAKTVASVSLVALTAAAQHPLYYGTFACFAAFRVESPNDLISSDISTNTNATALYSNLGHVVEYAVTGCTLVGLTAKILLWNKYKKVVSQLIETIYDRHIKSDSISKRTSNLIYKRKQRELARYA